MSDERIINNMEHDINILFAHIHKIYELLGYEVVGIKKSFPDMRNEVIVKKIKEK